jgi:lysyl-tRNA synthetase class 1
MFWADQIVQEIIEKRKPPFKVYDWWTPSGMAHAGHIRTFLLHQAIYQGLKLNGHEATYFYGFDDIDPMDGMPHDIPEHFKDYMGQPLYKIPSPVAGYESFADYYASKYLEAMEDLDIHPEVPLTSKMYLSGQFNEAITIVLDNAEKIRNIYADLGAERPNDWHAFFVVCENCSKIGTTHVYEWDGETVAYRCEPKLVKWAEGCGHEGRVSPYNGNGKMPWKVEWAAKWFLLGTDYEGGGKDHFTKNGSRDYAKRIVKDVFDAEEPIGYAHEFFLVGGKKMASSKGLGLSANDAAHILPPHIMRFFVYRVPPNRQIEFSPEGDTIPRIFDEFDRGLLALREDPESNEARAVVYSHQSEEPLPEYTMRFSKVTFLIQMPHVDIKEMAEKEKGSPLTDIDVKELEIRVEYAQRWLNSYADDTARFSLQPSLPESELTQQQCVYLAHISEQLRGAEWEGGELHTLLHNVKNNMNIPPKTAFSALYRIFLGKDNGPQAGWFLAALNRDFVLNRLEEAVNKGGNNA